MIAVSVENLVVKYKDFTAVKGISFFVNKGEIFGLLGPNGAGKTSTLEAIEGLRPVYGGIIKVLGFDPEKERLKMQEQTGVLLQGVTFFNQLKVIEIVKLFSSFYRNKTDTEDLIEKFLPGKRSMIFKKLSGGQKQRLGIILAFINAPELVILDEPSAGLDVQSKLLLWDFIRSRKASGKTIIIATHSMDEAESLCDRVAIIDEGEILGIDSPHGLVGNYNEICAASGMDKGIRNLEDVFIHITGRGLRD